MRTGSQEDISELLHRDLSIIKSERAVKHIYDAQTDKWDRILINVVVQDAFAEGSMRTAHYMQDLSEAGDKKFVLKLSKDAPNDTQVGRLAKTHHGETCAYA